MRSSRNFRFIIVYAPFLFDIQRQNAVPDGKFILGTTVRTGHLFNAGDRIKREGQVGNRKGFGAVIQQNKAFFITVANKVVTAKADRTGRRNKGHCAVGMVDGGGERSRLIRYIYKTSFRCALLILGLLSLSPFFSVWRRLIRRDKVHAAISAYHADFFG